MKKLIGWLKSPYPLRHGEFEDYRSIALTMLFVSIFIFLIRPFGMSNFPDELLFWILVQLGVGSFLISIVITQILPRFLMNDESWQIWKQLTLILCNVSVIALFLQYWVLESVEMMTFLTYLVMTLLLASGPLMIRLLLVQNKLLEHNLKQAAISNTTLQENLAAQASEKGEVDNSENKIEIEAEDGERLSLDSTNFIYVKAEKNYVEIYYSLDENYHSHVLRMTLVNLIVQLNSQRMSLINCHRSYSVSRMKVIRIVGNTRGYSLQLSMPNKMIPVSRAKSKHVLERLASKV